MVCKLCGVVKISRQYGVAMRLSSVGPCFYFVWVREDLEAFYSLFWLHLSPFHFII